MATALILQALSEVQKEKTTVREALKQRSERLDNEQSVVKKPGMMTLALAASLVKKG